MSAQAGNWIRQICNTDGTGDLLLTATPTTDVLAFSDVLPAGLTYYAIRDGDNRETGIGTFDGASTIVRTTVTSTKVGSVYLENGVPLDLSGASIVECTLNSAAFIEALHATAIKEDIAIRETAATGIVSGGLVSGNTATTVSLAGGDGEIIDAYTDRRNPFRINISWVAITSYLILMPSDIGVQVIYFDNTGTVQQKSGGLTSAERRTNIQVALVYYKSGSIIAVQNAGILSNEVGNTVYDWMYFTDIASRVKGLGLNPVNAVMSIWADAGQLISPGVNVASDLTNPNIETFPALGSATTAEPFDVVFEDGTTYLINQTVIPEFHESAPGVATGLTGNDSVIHYVYRALGNTLILQLGQPLYTDGKTARDSLEVNLAGFTQFTGAEVTLLIAQVYVANGTVDFTDSNKSGIVSLIGAGANASGGVSVSDFLSLTDVNEITHTGNEGKMLGGDIATPGVQYFDEIKTQGGNTTISNTAGTVIATFKDDLNTDLKGNINLKDTIRTLNYSSSGTGDGFEYNLSTNTSRSITGATSHNRFHNPNGLVGTIQTSGTSTSFNTASDYRLKENDIEIVDGITRVKALRPIRFNFISDNTSTVDGFLAHEAQAQVPESVHGLKDEVDEDGNPVYQGIDQAKLVPLLTAALKEEIQLREAADIKINKLEREFRKIRSRMSR